MTPPENREGRDADKTAVITKPTPQNSAQNPAEKKADSAAASGSSGGTAQDKTKPVSADKAAEAAAPAQEKPAAPATPAPTATPTPTPAPAATPAAPAEEKTVSLGSATPAPAPVADEPVIVSAPPPWQRVTNDTEAAQSDATATYVAPGAPPVPSAAEPPPAFPQTDPDTVKVQKPVVTGSAVPVGLGSSRTSVNMGNSGARPAASTPSARRPGRGPRRASLQVKRVDPWSVLKLALVLGVALFFVWLVAVGVLYGVLHGMGVWDKINSTANDLLQANEPGEPLISAGRVFGVSAIIGAVNIVLFTALATVGAFVYNVSADLAGGLELTLSERE
ncbi:Transmembrane protein of unknown function [Lentzea albidocapillata subsp. violacea]|uniref:DUF3566 domain-containing protein n=1 Tax=Lentzea albidocapillata subsp. violacea TaxID=128104 RepID=A0A1G9DA85_9PSEU|nr:Transmembrane protein of unknown function [Lentzea albidocapillata subsp. violacea]